jgi:hypothetical protein
MMRLRFKRHCSLLVALVLVALALILGLGEQRIVAYTVQSKDIASRDVALQAFYLH